MNGQAGKGDSRRPSSVSYEQYAANYNRIFRKGEPACGPGTTTEIGTLSPSGSTDDGSAGAQATARGLPLHGYPALRVCPACICAPCVCHYR
jgi:hypothetical protein